MFDNQLDRDLFNYSFAFNKRRSQVVPRRKWAKPNKQSSRSDVCRIPPRIYLIPIQLFPPINNMILDTFRFDFVSMIELFFHFYVSDMTNGEIYQAILEYLDETDWVTHEYNKETFDWVMHSSIHNATYGIYETYVLVFQRVLSDLKKIPPGVFIENGSVDYLTLDTLRFDVEYGISAEPYYSIAGMLEFQPK